MPTSDLPPVTDKIADARQRLNSGAHFSLTDATPADIRALTPVSS